MLLVVFFQFGHQHTGVRYIWVVAIIYFGKWNYQYNTANQAIEQPHKWGVLGGSKLTPSQAGKDAERSGAFRNIAQWSVAVSPVAASSVCTQRSWPAAGVVLMPSNSGIKFTSPKSPIPMADWCVPTNPGILPN